MLLYRIVPKPHAHDLSGTGAQRYGGRWNPKGVSTIYTAESAPQALLEYLPHFPETCLPPNLMIVSIYAPDTFSIKDISEKELPSDWNALPWPASTVNMGRKWSSKLESAALRVPSVMFPYGIAWNIVLNPLHPDFAAVKIHEIIPLSLDPRLANKLDKSTK
jgi:RES domain-containing protein